MPSLPSDNLASTDPPDPTFTKQNFAPSHPTPLFRFGLRQLFWFIALVSALLTGMALLKGIFAAILLLAALVVAVHIFATALGHRLRDRADDGQGWGQPQWRHTTDEASTERAQLLDALTKAPRSPWHVHRCTELVWLPRFIAFAAIMGGIAGMLLLSVTARQETSLGGLAVGSVSLGVLSGWFAFLFGSFFGVFRHGFHQAIAEQRKDEFSQHSHRGINR